MGFLLNIIASVLKWVLQPAMFIIGLVVSLSRREFNKWQMDLAYAKDVWGNVLIKYVADFVLIKKGGYRFGNKTKTISYVLGMNEIKGTLTIFGRILTNILNKLDKNHTQNAIKTNN